jgi:hypothetical protein
MCAGVTVTRRKVPFDFKTMGSNEAYGGVAACQAVAVQVAAQQ